MEETLAVGLSRCLNHKVHNNGYLNSVHDAVGGTEDTIVAYLSLIHTLKQVEGIGARVPAVSKWLLCFFSVVLSSLCAVQEHYGMYRRSTGGRHLLFIYNMQVEVLKPDCQDC